MRSPTTPTRSSLAPTASSPAGRDRRRCLDHLRNELDEGSAPASAVEGLAVVQMRLQHGEALRDADTPGDLPIA
jgi:hypothetical protein